MSCHPLRELILPQPERMGRTQRSRGRLASCCELGRRPVAWHTPPGRYKSAGQSSFFETWSLVPERVRCCAVLACTYEQLSWAQFTHQAYSFSRVTDTGLKYRASSTATLLPHFVPWSSPLIVDFISRGMARKIRDSAVFKTCHWFVATRSRRRALLRVAAAVLIIPLVLQWLLAYIVGRDARLLPPELLHANNVLIVTAHPDDECLFFSPTILGVLDRNRAINGGLLVMSTG